MLVSGSMLHKHTHTHTSIITEINNNRKTEELYTITEHLILIGHVYFFYIFLHNIVYSITICKYEAMQMVIL